MSRIGLRTRLAVALCSVAVLGIVLTTLFASQGVHPRLDEAAQARLERSAGHMAEITAAVYESEGGWTPRAVETLGHLAAPTLWYRRFAGHRSQRGRCAWTGHPSARCGSPRRTASC
jgi:hypothetical protein